MKNKLTGSQVKRLVIGVVILGLAIIIAMLVGGPLIFWSLLTWLVNKAVSNVGMNVWLARGLMVPVAALLFYAIGLTFSFKKEKRTTGAILLCVFLCLGSLAMYNFTKEQHFKIGTNEPAQWYSKTSDGYKLYPRPGYDPITGEQLQKVTPEVAKEIEILKQGKDKIIKPIQEEYQFFDFWGRPIRWYYKNAQGRIEIFDQPGSHPTYGEPLLPVNKEVVKEYLGQLEKEKSQKSSSNETTNSDQPVPPSVVEFSIPNEPEERNIKYTYIDYETARIESLKLYLDYLDQDRRIIPGADMKCIPRINDLINEIGSESRWSSASTQDVEILIRTWKELSVWKFIETSALETISNVPIFLASMKAENGLRFIKGNLQTIEKDELDEFPYINSTGPSFFYCLTRKSEYEPILICVRRGEKDFDNVNFQHTDGFSWIFKGKIIIKNNERIIYYDGELVLMEIVEKLKYESDSPNVKDLLNFIAQNSIWPKARERAAQILAQHK